MLRSRTLLAAENLFLRKQLAFYQEHKVQPQRLTDAARYTLALWSRLFEWKKKVSARWGCKANARQMWLTALRPNPLRWAMERVEQ